MSRASSESYLFAAAMSDELLVPSRRVLKVVESRRECGWALASGSRQIAIETGTAFDGAVPFATRELSEQLTSTVDALKAGAEEELKDCGASGMAVRLVVRSRFVSRGLRADIRSSVVAILNQVDDTDFGIVSTTGCLREDMKRMRADAKGVEADWQSLPILWVDGSGSVLLHEALGHPSEHEENEGGWPEWIHVRDVPNAHLIGDAPVDDCGTAVSSVDLTLGGFPAARRRQSFRDVPLRRMTNLICEQVDAPFDLPSDRIEVSLIASGSYDRLNERVSVETAVATLVRGASREPLAPFTIEVSRRKVIESLIGARGIPLRYPGVICSDDGQRVPVGCASADLLTSAFGL